MLLAVLWSAAAGAAETGYVIRVTDLKAKPFLDADTLAKLPDKTQVEILARQGPWMQVKALGKTGYVRMLQVRLNVTGEAQASPSPVPQVVSAVTRPAGASPTVTTGVRGFDEQGLKNAEPDREAFERMAGYAVSREQAQQFARSSPLEARNVPYYGADGKPLEEGGK
jgi:hypothetical protein